MMKFDENFTKMIQKSAQIAPKHRKNEVSRSKMRFEKVLRRKINKKRTKIAKKCPLRSGQSVGSLKLKIIFSPRTLQSSKTR